MLYVVGMEKKTLGERIAYARKHGLDRRLTQAEVAKELGVTPQAVSGWERDESMPDAEHLQALARMFGTSILWLLQVEKIPTREVLEKPLEQNPPRQPFIRTVRKIAQMVARDFPIYAASEGGNGFQIIHADVIEYVRRPTFLEGVPDAYGILVIGESMVPSYRPGDMALVHPGRPAQRDTDVILYKGDRRTGDAESMIKRLTGFNDKIWRLEQYNPPKSFTEQKSAWPICHQVVGRYNVR